MKKLRLKYNKENLSGKQKKLHKNFAGILNRNHAQIAVIYTWYLDQQ